MPSVAPSSSWECCSSATCAAPACVFLQQPRALPRSAVLHLLRSVCSSLCCTWMCLHCLLHPVLLLDLSVYSSKCCTWTCLSTTACAASGRICQHSTAACASSNISVYSSPTYRSLWTTAACAAPGCVCLQQMCCFRTCLSTAACAASNISVYSSITYRGFWTTAAVQHLDVYCLLRHAEQEGE